MDQEMTIDRSSDKIMMGRETKENAIEYLSDFHHFLSLIQVSENEHNLRPFL